MAVVNEITVEAEVRLFIPDSTAAVCLNVLQEYINQHPEKNIIETRQDNGTIALKIVNKHEDGRLKLKPRKANNDG